MLKFKKYLSVLLAVAMILSSVAVFADGEAAKSSVSFSDLDADTIVGKAVAELVPYGIISGYPDGTFGQDKTITRAEFAKIIVTFLNLQNIGTEGLPTGFGDVDQNSHWGQPYIRTAIDRGIILGYPDGTFKPDNPVKYCEAVKMMVCALNYGDVAASRTQPGQLWYSGYIAQAAELGILKNITVGGAEDPASRGLVAVLTSNSLDAEVAQQTVGGNGSTQGGGSTAREEFLQTEKVSGVVVGCNQTAIMGAEVKNSSRLITVYDGFDFKTYTVAYGTDTMALLGYKISANVNAAASGEYQEITAISKDRMNNVYTVDAALIDSVSNNGVEYWQSETSVNMNTAAFANNIEIVYNGKYLGSGAASYLDKFNIKAGNLVLISNDGDTAADVAFINNCEIFVVSSSGTDSATKQKKIYTLYGGGDIIVPEKSNYVKINNKGTVVEDPTSFSVSKYDVINLYRSLDGKVFNMTVTKNKKTGKIDALSGNEITIAGKDYTFAYNFADYSGADKPTFTVGNNISAYLDAEGRIAAAEASSTAATSNVFMGYLFGAEAGQGVGGVTKIRLYGMSSGKTGDRTYPVASNVKIDGVICDTGAAVESALSASAAEANANKTAGGVTGLQTYSQLIRFTLNVDGQVDSIDTVTANTVVANDDVTLSLAYPKMNGESVDSNIWVNSSDGSLKGYKYVSGNKFTNKLGSTVMGVNSSTMVLVVPENPSDITKYKSTKMSYFSTGNYYRVEGYCMNETNTAKYVVVYANTAAGEISDTADVVMANTVVQAVSSSDASITQDKLTGWNLKSGAQITDLRSETAGELYDDIQTGEIFRYSTDGEFVTDKEMILEVVNKVPVLFGKKLRGNDVDKAASADQAMEWRDVQYDKNKREKTASLSRVIYGTVVAKSEDDNGSNRVISITNTLLSDGEVFNVDAAYDYFNVGSSTKIYVLDTNATKVEDMITSDVDFNEISTVNDNGAADASQVLMFFSGSVKTIIIVR